MKPKARNLPARNQRLSSHKQRKQQHLLDVKVRSRAATRQRNLSVLACISGLFLISVALGGAWYGGREALRRYFWQNPDYALAEVAIHTDGSLTRQQIIDATKIQEGKNVFAINLSDARKGLMALPQVDRAEIERILPNKISIDIAERKPVAWVAKKDDVDPSTDPTAFLIDRDGVLMRVASEVPDYFHLPLICGMEVDNYEAGETVDLPEVKAALQLIRLTGENPARYQVRTIDVSQGYCMVVTDERHAKVTFPLDNIEAQLNRLSLLFENVDSAKREIQTVNLLVKLNVPVTFVPPPDPTADDAAAQPSASPAAGASSAPSPSIGQKKAAFLSTKTTAKRAQPVHKPHHSYTVRRAIPVSSTDTQP